MFTIHRVFVAVVCSGALCACNHVKATGVTPSGVKYEILKQGSGRQAQAGDFVQVQYTGWLQNGKQFDSSRDRGRPFSFPLGAGRVIRGWDEGVQGMRKGEIRRLTIPPQLAYGDRGAGDVIPPDATLVFEVELVDMRLAPPH